MAAEIHPLIVPVGNREFCTNYVTTAQLEAGEALGIEPNAENLLAAHRLGHFDSRYRPSMQQWHADQVENAFPWACAIGHAISVIGSFLVFHTYGIYDRQERTVAFTRALNEQVRGWNRPQDGGVRRAIRDFAHDQLAIDELNASRIQKYAISAIVFAAGGICTLAGALFKTAWLVTIGKVVIVAAVIATVFIYLLSPDTARLYSRIVIESNGNGSPSYADKILQNLPRLHLENMEFNRADMVNDRYLPLYPRHYVQWDYEVPAGV